MKILLAHRHYGVHKEIKSVEIKGEFSDYAKDKDVYGDYKIDEQKLLDALPADFLPVKPNLILLAISDKSGGTGQRGLSVFKDWAKYFDAYCINLESESD